jgi:pimeloyl-ACP methyl ester carboxylesterase/acyl carrier protein
MLSTNNTDKNIAIEQRTLLTAFIMDGFWERWIAHGVDQDDLRSIRQSFKSLEQWNDGWTALATLRERLGDDMLKAGNTPEAQYHYRLSSLYYNLAQWIYSSRNAEKEKWYRLSQEMLIKADQLSDIPVELVELSLNKHCIQGRIRVPLAPKGCLVILVPFDSNKEELFSYEEDFARAGYVTVCFDGPGQGDTFISSGLKATSNSWSKFVKKIINYSSERFSSLKLHLFGTSSGASWAIDGGAHPKVSKVVAVSPAILSNMDDLPIYFRERMLSFCEEEKAPLPKPDSSADKPILLFHGKKDVMVSHESMISLVRSIPSAELIEYEDEGHCCNFRLQEIRLRAVEWFGDNLSLEQFKKLISDIVKLPLSSIQSHSSFRDDLGIDSLQFVNVIISAAEQLRLDLNSLTSLEDIRTVEKMYFVFRGET